ncbi:DUF6020 family protein [Planococcus liqunii]|uniref:DUF6020 family protein n=1 Tax=Planococcus liqunii TaxID=3058394 RepID=UPI002607A8EB|nr:DUF6020 family protein [Planococcus sp. N056]WKA50235.1 DUF6020 family protein [Planococcus sp. N056]
MKKTYLVSAALLLAALFLSLTAVFYFQPILNASFWLIALVTLVLFALLIYIYPFARIIKAWPRPKQISLVIFLPIFSILASFSVRGEQGYLADNHLVIKLVVYFGMFLAVAILVMAIIKFFLAIKPATELQKVSPVYVLIYMLPMLAASMVMFIAFYPAAMTPDSMAQWEQAKTQEFTNWHPVMFTWTIMFLTKLWDSPGSVALFQIALLAITMGYLGYLMKRFNLHSAIIWVVLIGAALVPMNSILSITIWKDVTYSISLLFFSLLMILLVKTNGEETKKLSFMALFLISSFVLVFFRHNGFPVFVITMIVVLIMYRHTWKRLLPAALVIIVIHQIITGPVYTKLDVVDSDPQEALSIPTQQIANIVVNNGDMDDDQRAYVNSLMALEKWPEKYNPYSVDPIKFSWGDYDRWVIYNDWPGYFKMWGGLVVQNPALAIEGFLKQSSLVWQMNLPEDGRMNRYVTNIYYGNEFGLVNRVIYPTVTQAAGKYLSVDDSAKETIWRPAVYIFLSTLLIYIAYLRNNWRVWLLLLPIALNTGAVTATIPAQDFRYLFSNTLFLYAALFISLISFVPRGGGKLEK